MPVGAGDGADDGEGAGVNERDLALGAAHLRHGAIGTGADASGDGGSGLGLARGWTPSLCDLVEVTYEMPRVTLVEVTYEMPRVTLQS